LQGIPGDKGDIGAQGKSGTSLWNDGNGHVTTDVNVGIRNAHPSVALDVSGNVIANDPTADNHLATKSYVDAQLANISAMVAGGLKEVAHGYHTYYSRDRRYIGCTVLIGLENEIGQSYMNSSGNGQCTCLAPSVLLPSFHVPNTGSTHQRTYFRCMTE